MSILSCCKELDNISHSNLTSRGTRKLDYREKSTDRLLEFVRFFVKERMVEFEA